MGRQFDVTSICDTGSSLSPSDLVSNSLLSSDEFLTASAHVCTFTIWSRLGSGAMQLVSGLVFLPLTNMFRIKAICGLVLIYW
jgi:hypothetical protein